MKNINPQKKTNSINLQKKKLDDVEIDMSKISNKDLKQEIGKHLIAIMQSFNNKIRSITS